MKRTLFAALLVWMSGTLTAQEYSNFAEQTNRINALAKAYPSLATVRSLSKTNGG